MLIEVNAGRGIELVEVVLWTVLRVLPPLQMASNHLMMSSDLWSATVAASLGAREAIGVVHGAMYGRRDSGCVAR